MPIRSQALAAAVAGAVALVPAAAAPAVARTKPPKALPSPFHLEPKNRAAARHIALERKALDIINAAMRHVRGTVAGCDIRSALEGGHTETHDAPSADFLNSIAALRRPATPDELTGGPGVQAILPGATYVDYRRNVTAADGRTLTIVLGRRVVKPYIVPAKCLDAEHTEILRHLKGKPHTLRSATLKEFGQIRTGQEANASQPASGSPVDGVYLFHEGGGGGGADFAYFKKHGIFGSSGGDSNHATIDGLVPDGVATVKLIYPKVIPRGPDYKPTVYPSAVTLTLPVQENVVSASIPRSAPDAFARRMIWLDAAGNVLNDVIQP